MFNEGRLTLVECGFELYHSGAYIAEGGAVSRRLNLSALLAPTMSSW